MFKQNFNIDDLFKPMDNEIDAIEETIIENLIKIGRRFCSDIMVNREYKDQTFDLRSSTGFGVFRDGVLLHDEISGNPDGEAAGERLAKFVANSHEGIVLAVVAGMYYSVYLESKGRDVLTGSSYAAESYFKEVFGKLKTSMKRR